jgi:hypothetical protein
MFESYAATGAFFNKYDFIMKKMKGTAMISGGNRGG